MRLILTALAVAGCVGCSSSTETKVTTADNTAATATTAATTAATGAAAAPLKAVDPKFAEAANMFLGDVEMLVEKTKFDYDDNVRERHAKVDESYARIPDGVGEPDVSLGAACAKLNLECLMLKLQLELAATQKDATQHDAALAIVSEMRDALRKDLKAVREALTKGELIVLPESEVWGV